MTDLERVDTQLKTQDWLVAQLDSLLTEYKLCRTEYAKNQIYSKILMWTGKTKSEIKWIEKFLPEELKIKHENENI
jgi:hypothetical protein